MYIIIKYLHGQNSDFSGSWSQLITERSKSLQRFFKAKSRKRKVYIYIYIKNKFFLPRQKLAHGRITSPSHGGKNNGHVNIRICLKHCEFNAGVSESNKSFASDFVWWPKKFGNENVVCGNTEQTSENDGKAESIILKHTLVLTLRLSPAAGTATDVPYCCAVLLVTLNKNKRKKYFFFS